MPWAERVRQRWLPLRLGHVAKGARRRAIEEALAWSACRLRASLSARTVGRHEDARLDRARARHRPAVLLMDEPFAALDEITRIKLNDELLALKCELRRDRRFRHPFGVRERLSVDRIVVMAPRPGRVVAEIAIDAPCPRDEDFRTSAAYAGHVPRDVSRRCRCRRWARICAEARRDARRFVNIVLPLRGVARALVRPGRRSCVNDIPPYILPAPSLIAMTLVNDWGTLSASLLVTSAITFEALLAALSAASCWRCCSRSGSWIERAFFPFAVVLQVTPVVSIAPLLSSICASRAGACWSAPCSWRSSRSSRTPTLGLNSADHNLSTCSSFTAPRAGRSCLSAHALRAAVFPRRLAHRRRLGADRRGRRRDRRRPAATGRGSPIRIVESGYRLNIPRMFAALVLLISLPASRSSLCSAALSYLLAAPLARQRAETGDMRSSFRIARPPRWAAGRRARAAEH